MVPQVVINLWDYCFSVMMELFFCDGGIVSQSNGIVSVILIRESVIYLLTIS